TRLLWPLDGRGPDPAALRWPCGALTASPYVVSAYVPAARSTKDSTERTRASRRGRCRTRATAQTARDGGIASSGRNKSVPDKLVVLELWADQAALNAHAQVNITRPPNPVLATLRADGTRPREDYVYNRTR